LAGLADEGALRGERLVLAERASLEQRAVYRGREWAVAEIALSLEEGLGFRGSVDPTVAALLAALDGQCTLGEIAAGLARNEGASSAALEQALLPAVREMFAAGFLERR
jgi:hypothetical protein